MKASPQVHSPYAVVFDLEFTAWDGAQERDWMLPGEYRELVQIGAVKVDAGFAPLESFDCYVRPRLNPELSDYMQELTGITNDEIRARGVDFAEAWHRFAGFAGGLPILAFGRDDRIFAENVRLYGLQNLPPLPRFIDLRGWLTANGIDVTNFRACDVGPAAGVPFEGRKHNGLADARSVAAGIRALMARGARSPVNS